MIARFISKLNEDGILGLIAACKNKIHTKTNTYSLDLVNYDADLMLSGFSFEKLTTKHLLISEDDLPKAKYDLIRDRIDNDSGLIPFVVLFDNVVCGYYHIAFDGYYDTTVKLMYEVCSNSAFFFDDHTFLHSRGKGCHKFSIIMRINFLKSLGYTRVFVNIVEGNVFSERAYTSLGFCISKSTSYYFRLFHMINKL
jgi:hypothetical protein